MNSKQQLKDIRHAFAGYPLRPAFDCSVCHTQEDLDYFTSTPLEDLTKDHLRTMLWETADHWASTEAFKHFLPRLLEVLGPPHFVEDLYPKHTFETLLYHGFTSWPVAEKEAVLGYLAAITADIPFFDQHDKDEWNKGMRAISANRKPA